MEYLLPPELFEGLNSPVLLVILVVALALVAKGADWLVDGAVGIAERLRIPKTIIGATVVSLGTTTPEAAVSVMAAFKGLPDLALGNAVGSIICDTALIFGLCCLLTRLPMDRFVLNRHGWVQFGSGLLLVLLCIPFRDAVGNAVLPRLAGGFLVLLLIAYLYMSYVWGRQHSAADAAQDVEAHEHRGGLALQSILMVVGLAMVLFGSHALIQSVSILCERIGVPPAIIAATLVAFGTSTPELVTALTCVKKGQTDLLVGNVIGADVLNVLFVAGLSACAAPLVVEPLFYRLHFPVMMGALLLFRISIATSKERFARWPGAILLTGYVAYLIANYLMGGPSH